MLNMLPPPTLLLTAFRFASACIILSTICYIEIVSTKIDHSCDSPIIISFVFSIYLSIQPIGSDRIYISLFSTRMFLIIRLSMVFCCCCYVYTVLFIYLSIILYMDGVYVYVNVQHLETCQYNLAHFIQIRQYLQICNIYCMFIYLSLSLSLNLSTRRFVF